jgi:hypothetical protein
LTNRLAVANPIPLAPPVTTTRLSFRSSYITDRNLLFSTSNVPYLPASELGSGMIDSRPIHLT